MRTLQIYSGNLYGGVETTLTMITRHANVSDTQRRFALCFSGRLSDELASLGAGIHFLGPVRVRRPLSVWMAKRRLSAVLAGTEFDVAICHSAWTQALFGPVVRRARVPLVFWLHDVPTGRHWLERWARRTPPDLVICNSHFTARSAPAMYPTTRVEVLHPPMTQVDRPSAHVRTAVRRGLGTSDSATVIIQVSRLEPYKGHMLHLEALSRLVSLSESWVCWVVGGVQRPHERAYLAELKRAAVRLGIAERVRFLGQRQDVPDLLAAADIHCQPNIRPEPFGITFIEALAAGLPVVTTAMGGALEIVDASCGLLVPPGRADNLAAALGRLIQNPGLRSALGASGPFRASALCDPARQLRRLDGILASATKMQTA